MIQEKEIKSGDLPNITEAHEILALPDDFDINALPYSDGLIGLTGVANTRDLGAITTLDGKEIKKMRLIRSGTLGNATAKDIEILAHDYNLQTIIDFRTAEEQEKKPDPAALTKDANYVLNSLLGAATLGITRGTLAEDVREGFEGLLKEPLKFMSSIYPKMILDPMSQQSLSHFFDMLLEAPDGSILWHCTAGKDRAGIATVFLLSIFNVPAERIVFDYLATNRYMSDSTNEILSKLEPYGIVDKARPAVEIMNSANMVFLKAAMNTIVSEFGSIDTYLTEVLGVTEGKREALREKFLLSVTNA